MSPLETALRRPACLLALALPMFVGCAAETEEDVATDNAELLGGRASFKQPAVGKLLVRRGDKMLMCTGSLVSSRAVLTASHCFGDIDRAWLPQAPSTARPIVRVKGSFVVELSAQYTVAFDVDAFLTFGSGPGADDIAIAHLSRPVPSFLATPLRISDARPHQGELVSIFGYGCNSADGKTRTSSTGTKQELDTWYGQAKRVVCRGDSGGPHIYHGPTGDIFAVTSATTETPRILFWGGDRGDDIYGDAVKHRDMIRFYARSLADMSASAVPSSPRAD